MTETYKSSIDRSQKFKEEGNKEFSSGGYQTAIKIYTKGLEALDSIKDNHETNLEIKQKRSVLNLNIGMCYYKLGNLKESLTFTDIALENHPEYVKALYRKAVILKDMKDYEESIRFIRSVLALEPNNKEAKELSNSLREQLITEDNENKDPLLHFQKEVLQHNNELDLKRYQQYLLQTIDTSEEALKFYKKHKLKKAFLEAICSELSHALPNATYLNYLFMYTVYFYQTLFEPLFEFQEKKSATPETQTIEIFRSLSHNISIIKIYNRFIQLALESSALPLNSKIHENFIKLFKFVHIINLDKKEFIEEGIKTLIDLGKFYQTNASDQIKHILSTIRSCIRLNLACVDKHKKNQALEAPLISLLEFLMLFFKDQGLTTDYECFVIGINLYLDSQSINSFEEFTQSSLYKRKLSSELLTIYSLLLVKPKIGARHFSSLLNQDWQKTFLDYLSNPKNDTFHRKIAFEVLSLYIKDIESSKDLLARKGFLDTLVKTLFIEKQPLFQLKTIVVLVKLVLQQPTEEVVKEFERIFDPGYLGGLLDYLKDHKEINEVLEFVELILGLSYIDDFKIKLSKIPILFTALNNFISLKTEEKDKQNSLNLAILLFLSNMLTDSKGENYEEQKKRYNIQEEDLQKLEALMNSSNQIHTMPSKYTKEYITLSGVPDHILKTMNFDTFCRSILNNAEFIKGSKLLRANLPKLFAKLTSHNEKEKTKLLRKDVIRVCLLAWDNSTEQEIKEDIAKFLSNILVACNPNIFDYTESIQIVDILAFAIFKSSHELIIFEATSSLVQFSSLNEDICKRLLDKHQIWGTLVLNLCEENDYIVHATLELLNNLSLSETLQTTYSSYKTIDRECKVIKALLQKYSQERIKVLLEDDELDDIKLQEAKLFGNYNTLFQKIALLIGIPVFLNFSKELIGSFEKQEDFFKIFEDIFNLLSKIESLSPEFMNLQDRGGIIDLLYKISLIIDDKMNKEQSNLKKSALEVVQKILTPYTTEFSHTDQEKLNEFITKLAH